MRLIDADLVIDNLANEIKETYTRTKDINDMISITNGLECAKVIVDNTPTVNSIKYGYWKLNNGCGDDKIICSECGSEIYSGYTLEYAAKIHKFCPHCGANMKENRPLYRSMS